jgi:hypothetical protein
MTTEKIIQKIDELVPSIAVLASTFRRINHLELRRSELKTLIENVNAALAAIGELERELNLFLSEDIYPKKHYKTRESTLSFIEEISSLKKHLIDVLGGLAKVATDNVTIGGSKIDAVPDFFESVSFFVAKYLDDVLRSIASRRKRYFDRPAASSAKGSNRELLVEPEIMKNSKEASPVKDQAHQLPSEANAPRSRML